MDRPRSLTGTKRRGQMRTSCRSLCTYLRDSRLLFSTTRQEFLGQPRHAFMSAPQLYISYVLQFPVGSRLKGSRHHLLTPTACG